MNEIYTGFDGLFYPVMTIAQWHAFAVLCNQTVSSSNSLEFLVGHQKVLKMSVTNRLGLSHFLFEDPVSLPRSQNAYRLSNRLIQVDQSLTETIEDPIDLVHGEKEFSVCFV